MKLEKFMPSFVGSWATTRYSGEDPENPEQIALRISADSDPDSLDGSYARPGQDARMFGGLGGGGVMWQATIDEQNSTGDVGNAVFFISEDGNTIHGAWSSSQHNHGPQPWFGTRV